MNAILCVQNLVEVHKFPAQFADVELSMCNWKTKRLEITTSESEKELQRQSQTEINQSRNVSVNSLTVAYLYTSLFVKILMNKSISHSQEKRSHIPT